MKVEVTAETGAKLQAIADRYGWTHGEAVESLLIMNERLGAFMGRYCVEAVDLGDGETRKAIFRDRPRWPKAGEARDVRQVLLPVEAEALAVYLVEELSSGPLVAGFPSL